jgi:outer membrane protein OmpA-like peptidoglycan-associated protein
VDARLLFQARCLKNALDSTPLKTLELGEITGQVEVSALGEPRFTVVGVPAQINDPKATAANSVTFQRTLSLTFGAEFRSAPRSLFLLLDDAELEGSHHVELVVTLSVAGATEAAAAVNDVLDIPLKREFLALNLLDEVGEPLASQDVSLSYDEGTTVELSTDAKGQVRVQNPPGGGKALLDFPNFDALRQELKRRWDKPRNKPRLRANRAVAVVSMTDTLDTEITLDPGVRSVSLQPRVELVRFVGLFFETSKSFLLPAAKNRLGELQTLYDAHPTSTLLVVGHADRAGSSSYNDQLSLERANAMASFLNDDVDGFTKFYEPSVAKEKRWGDREDRFMLTSLDDGAALFATGDPVQAFRSSRSIEETGPTGPATREALVGEYMASDKAVLPDSIQLVTHGCGENFPDVPTRDGAAEEENRRVELFFFDTGLGVQPPPPGKSSGPNSTAYPEWRSRAQQTHEFDLRLGETRLLRLRLLDSAHQPLAGMDWSVLHELGTETGQTDDGGNLSARVPARVESAVLVHDFGSLDLGIILFPPAAEVLGTQLRLNNLGYECPTQGTLDAETQDALLDFQFDHDLDETGSMDPPTLSKLEEIYGQ